MKAMFPGVCRRCGQDINVGDEIIALFRKDYIHRGCASGQDDQ